MSIVIFQIKEGAPTSVSLSQKGVMAKRPDTGQLKYIGYYKGQDSIFVEDINNKDLQESEVPPFVLNQSRNKCELRFDDGDTQLYKYLTSRPGYGSFYELYSEAIESQRKLGKAEAIEKALELIKESDELKIRALGLAVLGVNAYNQNLIIIKSDLKEKAINSPNEVIKACEDELFENKFIASLALCSGIVETNSTMTAIVWADNKGRLINIATGEDFITKFAKHLSEKNPENQSLLQELGTRLELSKKAKSTKSKEADEIAKLKEQLAQAQMEKEIAEGKLAKVSSSEEIEEPSLEQLAILELREKYKEVVGKNAPFTYHNNIEWMQAKIDEKES